MYYLAIRNKEKAHRDIETPQIRLSVCGRYLFSRYIVFRRFAVAYTGPSRQNKNVKKKFPNVNGS